MSVTCTEVHCVVTGSSSEKETCWCFIDILPWSSNQINSTQVFYFDFSKLNKVISVRFSFKRCTSRECFGIVLFLNSYKNKRIPDLANSCFNGKSSMTRWLASQGELRWFTCIGIIYTIELMHTVQNYEQKGEANFIYIQVKTLTWWSKLLQIWEISTENNRTEHCLHVFYLCQKKCWTVLIHTSAGGQGARGGLREEDVQGEKT